MKIYVSQIYIQVGVSFPFSHHMQLWLGEQLSTMITITPEFRQTYGVDFDLIVQISARKGLVQNEIKGPTVFKKTKDVEYTIFLPYDVIARAENGCGTASTFILDGIQAVLTAAHLDAGDLAVRRDSFIKHICTEPAMLKGPWPSVPA